MAKLPHDQRRAVIVTASVEMAIEKGLMSLTHPDVAKRCTDLHKVVTSPATVRRFFPRLFDLYLVVAEDNRSGKDIKHQAKSMGVERIRNTPIHSLGER